MTSRNTSAWGPNLIGPLNLQIHGVDQTGPKRGKINFAGSRLSVTASDDPEQDVTTYTVDVGNPTVALASSSADLVAGDVVCIWPTDTTGGPVTRGDDTALGLAGGALSVVEASYTHGATNVTLVPRGAQTRACASDLGTGTAGEKVVVVNHRAKRVSQAGTQYGPHGGEKYLGTCDAAGTLTVDPTASLQKSPYHVINVVAYGVDNTDKSDSTTMTNNVAIVNNLIYALHNSQTKGILY